MQLRYVGGLSSVTVGGAKGSCGPGGVLEVADERLAALAVETGDWEPVGDKKPEQRAAVRPTPQKGG